MIENWRQIAIVVILSLGFLDLFLTLFYIYIYKNWQPNKPYSLIEKNPFLVFLWNKLGLFFGSFVGATIILTLQYIITKEAHWIIVGLLFCFLLFTLYNHYTNINLLSSLINKYPEGHLPVETFGKVIGNNLK